MKKKYVVLAFVLVLGASLVVPANEATGEVKQFSSYNELEEFLKTRLTSEPKYKYYTTWSSGLYAPASSLEVYGTSIETGGDFQFVIGGESNDGQRSTESSPKYSTTNVQVKKVDEPDIVKTDGNYIYVASGSTVYILRAYPIEYTALLSKIREEGSPLELFVVDNRLAVLGSSFVKIYDISDKREPTLIRSIKYNGKYFTARLVGRHIYLVARAGSVSCRYKWEIRPIFLGIEREVRRVEKLSIELPKITVDTWVKPIKANEIRYFDVEDRSYGFTLLMSIDLEELKVKSRAYLAGSTQTLYMSPKNLYLTYSKNSKETFVYKITLNKGEIGHEKWAKIPGRVLNQFSMDEYRGYFRIATTTGWYGSNNVYVLDEDMKVIGKLEGLAPGERIYSARFMGDRGYLVTFRKVDPLFVIDLSNPTKPRVLGKLKIPGYSNYLHPYDKTHLIGIGKDTIIDSEWGSFAWFQGVKVALFDVSDPEYPQEISKYVVGERGTDSQALHDHRAFLFIKDRNLLVIPISLVDDELTSEGSSWQGAYVFHVSPENGIELKGKITHGDNWSSGEYSVRRSLYIDNALYTISNRLVKVNDLVDLELIKEIQLE